MEFKLSFQFLCFLLCLMLLYGDVGEQEKRNPEREALISFETGLQNRLLLSSWYRKVNHCGWDGVTCQLGRVTMLALPSWPLKGPLSPSLSSLSSLIVLDFSSNLLFGQIPVEFAELAMLETLELGFPQELGYLKALRKLELSTNGLSGTVPIQLGKLTQLEFLDLANNLLSGSLPLTIFKNLQTLASLDISINSFSGNIPPEIGDLRNPNALYIGSNQFTGQLPPQIGKLSLLENFFAPSCSITGPLPEELFSLKRLAYLDLSYNPLKCSIPKSMGKLKILNILNHVYSEINGSLPAELDNCRKLMMLMLSFNSISGPLHEELSNLPMLTFSAERNLLSEPLPSWLGKWNKVESLLLSSNRFSGNIPPEIGSCSMLKHLSLSNNNLSGSIPRYLSELPLMVIDIGSNDFTGTIPVSLWSSNNLMELSAGNNMLEGTLPVEIGNAVTLQTLVLSHNRLKGRLTTLDLGNNILCGSIPEELADLELLQCLVLSHNNLSGSIPSKPSLYFRQVNIPDLSFVQHHGVFDLSNNRLTAPIPEELGNCVVVVDLLLNNNMLSGKIPESLSQLANLTTLDLSGNLLTYLIPVEFGDFLKLQGLYLGNNQLTGAIPGNLGLVDSLVKLNLTGNKLSGVIPNRLSGGVAKIFSDSLSWKVEDMNLSNDIFSGHLPHSLGNLSYVSYLYLHGNMFSGEIPSQVGNLMQLEYFDVSANRLPGRNMRAVRSILLESHRKLVRSQQSDPEETKLKTFIDQELYFLSSSRSKELLSINIAMFKQPLVKLTLGDIVEGTSHFCKTNIIGDGGFGTVYKAKLPSGKTVAVKKLSQAKTQGHREFIAEMETLGALDILDWSKRFKIAIGSARGLAFLHHGFIPHIIHRDIKASNILLSEVEPKIADFGLARLISASETHVSTDIAGPLGYIPLEYGQSGRCTTKGDVYSFGVILLELVTGKEPIGPDFKEIEGGNLVGWVSKKTRSGQAADVLDAMVLDVDSKQMMFKVLSVAQVCLSENPANRPTMLQVLKLLEGVK
ncbi:Detected protein of confused Function [Hibiscus syriacus]|uniref:non-specific serine/threonine protein kinase n=1 Tax=Hibiscus syriacus TaxID=106335 RepID=A0A6A3BLI6_HIBSY|nr:Detected protein of confused Function [Hibiscus syriacus]